MNNRRNHGILKKQSQSRKNFSKYATKPKLRNYEIKGEYIHLGKQKRMTDRKLYFQLKSQEMNLPNIERAPLNQ